MPKNRPSGQRSRKGSPGSGFNKAGPGVPELTVREVIRSGGDRAAILSMAERSANLSEEERGCVQELLDIYLNNREEGYFFLIAELSGVLAGFVCYGETPIADAAYDIYWIVVDPDYRGRGVGTRLLKRTEEILGADGARLLLAETSGLEGYAPARSFYRSRGFREEARIKGLYKPGDDLVIFVKRF